MKVFIIFFMTLTMNKVLGEENCLTEFSEENFSSVVEQSDHIWLIRYYNPQLKEKKKIEDIWIKVAETYCNNHTVHIGQVDM